VLDNVLVALAGISAYFPEDRSLLASMVEGGGANGGDKLKESLSGAMASKLPWSVQVRAPSVPPSNVFVRLG